MSWRIVGLVCAFWFAYCAIALPIAERYRIDQGVRKVLQLY